MDLTRFEEKIKEYEGLPVDEGKILLYGSSFFCNWGTQAPNTALCGLMGLERPIVNHGFGGSTGEEQLYYYARMVKPYKPSVVVWRSGFNEINAGASGNEAFQMTLRLLKWTKTDFPNVKQVVLPIFECPHYYNVCIPRGTAVEMKIYNSLLSKYILEREDLFYLDITEFLAKDGKNPTSAECFKDIFRPDGLHLTSVGYEQFAEYFKGKMQKMLIG